MLLLTSTSDKVQVVNASAVELDIHTSYVDYAAGTVTPGRKNTSPNTAATSDIVDPPAGSTQRNVKTINIRNQDAALSDVVTVRHTDGTTPVDLVKVTLLAGETLIYFDGVWTHLDSNGVPKIGSTKLDICLRVTSDSIHATAATFADITGLTTQVFSGKQYVFEAYLFHIANATTTGAQFGINGPAMTGMRISQVDVILGSLTAATMGSNTTDVTARDTASMAETTGAATVVVAALYGWFNPSADGTFAVRATSEVTVAAGLTVKQGSWCRIRETDN